MDRGAVGVPVREPLDVLDRTPALQVVDQLYERLFALVADDVVAEIERLIGKEGDVGTRP